MQRKRLFHIEMKLVTIKKKKSRKRNKIEKHVFFCLHTERSIRCRRFRSFPSRIDQADREIVP